MFFCRRLKLFMDNYLKDSFTEKRSAMIDNSLLAINYSAFPFSPANHCSLFLNSTLNVVSEP